jgi:hypothetical protein
MIPAASFRGPGKLSIWLIRSRRNGARGMTSTRELPASMPIRATISVLRASGRHVRGPEPRLPSTFRDRPKIGGKIAAVCDTRSNIQRHNAVFARPAIQIRPFGFGSRRQRCALHSNSQGSPRSTRYRLFADLSASDQRSTNDHFPEPRLAGSGPLVSVTLEIKSAISDRSSSIEGTSIINAT